MDIHTPQPTVGIVIGSTREHRFGEKAAHWIHGLAKKRADLRFELLDLRDYPLPFFDGMSPSRAPVKDETARRWGAKLAQLDGFIFVTAEYNHSITGVLKNALDWAYHEYDRKPAAYVGYGGVGASRAVEQLRLINVELKMAPLRSAVHIGGADFMGMLMQGKTFDDMPHLAQAANLMLDELAWWTKALKAAREAAAETAPA
ncbi:MAG TPA: NAD(P)H-dependent oxidoreductase [Burkholderiales bacterium]|nr:NAD(P)H-dependent oxidoreductase [Burkholderiales bacterium]